MRVEATNYRVQRLQSVGEGVNPSPATFRCFMKLYFAPLEGLTDSIFRRAHAELFGGADRYYTPFLTPTQNHRFSGRERREIQGNAGMAVVPQLLTNHAGHFLWAAEGLAEMGFDEVNLNLGCPSGTVTAKKKGAGQLGDLDALGRFFDEVLAAPPLPVSVKTRIGLHDPAEFDAILALFCRYPLAELIVHPRVRDELYQGTPHVECFAAALERCPFPVCYNGDLTSAADAAWFAGRFPQAQAVMIGRGALANPGIFREIRGQARATRDELYEFHARLYRDYCAAFSGERPVLCRMKEIWSYLRRMFPDSERQWKAIRKAGKLRDYEAAVEEMFRSPLKTGA